MTNKKVSFDLVEELKSKPCFRKPYRSLDERLEDPLAATAFLNSLALSGKEDEAEEWWETLDPKVKQKIIRKEIICDS